MQWLRVELRYAQIVEYLNEKYPDYCILVQPSGGLGPSSSLHYSRSSPSSIR